MTKKYLKLKIQKFMKAIPLFILLFLAFILFTPCIGQAAYTPAQFKPQITIGEFVKDKPITVENTGETIWNYIKAIYKYAIGVVGIVAAVVLMIGGIIWLTAGGNQTRIGEAKAYIGASLTGLLIALTSFLILATVNPKLTQFNPLDITTATDTSSLSKCCEKNKSNLGALSQATCTEQGGTWSKNSAWDDKEKKCVNMPYRCYRMDSGGKIVYGLKYYYKTESECQADCPQKNSTYKCEPS